MLLMNHLLYGNELLLVRHWDELFNQKKNSLKKPQFLEKNYLERTVNNKKTLYFGFSCFLFYPYPTLQVVKRYFHIIGVPSSKRNGEKRMRGK